MEKIIELLSQSSNRSEKKLAKQLLSYLDNPSGGKKYRLDQKLYLTLLKSIDEETAKRLINIERQINKIRDYIIKNSGWTFNRNEAYAQDFVFQEFDEKDDPYLYYVVRDKKGFHTRTNRPNTPYKESVRANEKHFLLQFGAFLNDAHVLMQEKDNILFNRLFKIKAGSEELVNAILVELKYDYSVKTPILNQEENKKSL